MSDIHCTADPTCPGPVRARGWCSKHYQRWARLGSPTAAVRERTGSGPACKPVVGYSRNHARLKEAFGPPQLYYCIDGCGRVATDWSLSPMALDVMTDHRGHPYALDLTNYDPRCRSCHKRLDNAIRRDQRSCGSTR